MTIKSYSKENQIQEIATMVRDSGNTTVIDLYAVQDRTTGLIVGNRFYTTRQQARDVRRTMDRNDVKVVKTNFVNVSPWRTAK